MPKPQTLPAPLGNDATSEQALDWLVKFASDPNIKHWPAQELLNVLGGIGAGW